MLSTSLSTMFLYKNVSFFVLFVISIYSLVSCDGISVTASDSSDKRTQISSLSSPTPDAAELNSAVFKPGLDSMFSLSLLSSLPEDPEISDYCTELLHIFGQRYVTYVSCLIPAARPVKLCQNCFHSYDSLMNIYTNISEKTSPGNESCRDSLLRSDRLMLVSFLYSQLEELWETSHCNNCIADGFQSLNNGTLSFLTTLNKTLTCFENYEQGNRTEICKNCKSTYKSLNELYRGLEKNNSLCMDIEDAMNITRRLWSKHFKCSFSREETVPVIAVSSFMLFLPIIFYLSSFLHSEQKKRKLIHPKRAKSYTSLMNIQDRVN